MIKVLDKGYVRLVDHMGTDLSVVNSARVSYNKETDSLEERDLRLMNFLWREEHDSPFRHATMQFEIYAPLMVARQWFKYIVGSDHTMDAWNESSRRYITENEEFYIPYSEEWRSAPESSKQGSGPNLSDEIGIGYTKELLDYVAKGEALYESAMADGIAPEQARLFLPANGLYVRWYWTGSLQSVIHFINQRIENDAQYEIREYAKVVREIAETLFPNAIQIATKEID